MAVSTLWLTFIIATLSLTSLDSQITNSKMCHRDNHSNCNILTWNVQGAMFSAGSLSYLLDLLNVDLACITEHKLKQNSSAFLNSIHNCYNASTICENVNIESGCGKGGVSILYKKALSFFY